MRRKAPYNQTDFRAICHADRPVYARDLCKACYLRLRRYGVGFQELRDRLAAQGRACAICDTELNERTLMIDHDHETGAVRGLLCFKCNCHIVNVVENHGHLIARALAYLDDHKETI